MYGSVELAEVLEGLTAVRQDFLLSCTWDSSKLSLPVLLASATHKSQGDTLAHHSFTQYRFSEVPVIAVAKNKRISNLLILIQSLHLTSILV